MTDEEYERETDLQGCGSYRSLDAGRLIAWVACGAAMCAVIIWLLHY